MIRRQLLVLVCLVLTGSLGAAQPEPVTIGPKDPAITYVGRFDFNQPGEARAAWPATSVKLRFTGTGVSAILHTNGTDWVQVVVDGKPTKAIALTTTAAPVALAEGLPDAEHTVEVVKRTEAWAIMGFGGFQLPAGARALPAAKRPDRRIEIYGDSISCGYGDEAANGNAHFTPETANAWLAYGPVAAREVGAECSVVAVSGIKLWPDNMLPPRAEDALRPWDGAPKPDLSGWIPQAVVIDLGTNDVGPGVPDEQGWCDAMRAFIKTIRGHYPDCHVYLATGSMLTGDKLDAIKRYLDAVAGAAAKAGDHKIHRIDFDPQQPAADGVGADWHPSVRTHRKMADKLAAALKTDLGWQPAR